MFLCVVLCHVYGVIVLFLFGFCFFFFKQKTAYEMRISDWSSDVCSSDLRVFQTAASIVSIPAKPAAAKRSGSGASAAIGALGAQIGRASCRERVCQYV